MWFFYTLWSVLFMDVHKLRVMYTYYKPYKNHILKLRKINGFLKQSIPYVRTILFISSSSTTVARSAMCSPNCKAP